MPHGTGLATSYEFGYQVRVVRDAIADYLDKEDGRHSQNQSPELRYTNESVEIDLSSEFIPVWDA